MVVSRRTLVLVLGRCDLAGGGRSAVLYVPPVLAVRGRPVAVVAVGLGCPVEEALHHIAIFELVVHRIAMVGAWLLQELVEVVVSRRALILALSRRDLADSGRPAVLLVLPILTV